MSQKQITENKTETKISVCDIMKNNTSEIIKKLETQIPSSVQQYSDLYTTYLHTIDDIFGTCYIAEKELYDKLNLDQGVLKEFQEFSNVLTKTYLDQIEMSSKYVEAYVQIRKSSLKTYDNFMHVVMDSYAKTLSQFNKFQDSVSQPNQK
jgi:hypothetical protein